MWLAKDWRYPLHSSLPTQLSSWQLTQKHIENSSTVSLKYFPLEYIFQLCVCTDWNWLTLHYILHFTFCSINADGRYGGIISTQMSWVNNNHLYLWDFEQLLLKVYLHNQSFFLFVLFVLSLSCLLSVWRDHLGPKQHLLGGHCRAQHPQHAWWLQPVGRDEEEEELQPHEQEGSWQDASQHCHGRKRAQVLHAGWVKGWGGICLQI